jgi:general secretion pathway protein E
MLKNKIGEILIDLDILAQEQLNECLQDQKTTEKLLGQILIERGFIGPKDLARALANQIEIPFIETITEQMADLDLLKKVPLKFLKQQLIVPVMFEEQRTIVTANPRDLQPLDDLSLLLGGNIRYAVSTENMINDTINKYYPLESSREMMDELTEEEGGGGEFGISDEIEEKDIMEMANEAPIVKLVNHILFQAVKENTSDIHIEPYEKELRVRYRIDGSLYQRVIPPKRYQGAIVSRIKIMANLNIAEKRIPQDGRIQIKVADKAIDIRVSILPTNFGEKVVMRLLDKTRGAKNLESLNLSERDFETVRKIIERPNGIILVSGPTGSGKTTTLYSILARLNAPDVNIMTAENPVEYTINGLNQVNINEKVGLTFASALRAFLRQDPDIILVGEIRDKETAQIAIEAALTGHLVLSTIHTNNAPATVTRLTDMGIEPFLIASALVCVISQRLVRKLCDKCKQQFSPDLDMIKRVGISPNEAKNITFYQAVGCDDCLKRGYMGRLPIFEVMEISEDLTRLIIKQSDASALMNQAIKEGMTILGMDGIRCIKDGRTTIEEVLTVAHVEEEEESPPPPPPPVVTSDSK